MLFGQLFPNHVFVANFNYVKARQVSQNSWKMRMKINFGDLSRLKIAKKIKTNPWQAKFSTGVTEFK